MRKAIIIVGSQENFRLEGTSGSPYSKLLLRAVWPHFWSQTRMVGALSSFILKISKVGACTVAVGTLIAFTTNKFLIFSQDLSSSNFCLLVLIVPPKPWSAWIPPVGSVPHMYLGTLLLDWIWSLRRCEVLYLLGHISINMKEKTSGIVQK